jgi:hypothetical protein
LALALENLNSHIGEREHREEWRGLRGIIGALRRIIFPVPE